MTFTCMRNWQRTTWSSDTKPTYRTMQFLIQQCLRASTSRALSSSARRLGYDSGAITTSTPLSRTCSRELMCNSVDRHSQTYSSAAVATDAEQSSNIGVNTLRRGGNAVDAAIAVMLSVGVVNLHSTGIGGGGFMVIYNSNSRRSYAIDFRDKAPLNASTFMLDRYGMGYKLHALNSVCMANDIYTTFNHYHLF